MKIILKLFVLSACILPYHSLSAALLSLSTGPLLLSNSAKPNVFFMLDDSGSMDWESLISSSVWEACAYDPNSGGSYNSTACGSQASDGTQRGYGGAGYRDFVYIYKATDNKYSYNCSDLSYNSIEACPESGTSDWRFFSNDVNVIYYDPNTTYTPWNTTCLGTAACTNASFTAARSNPKAGTLGYSLTRNLGRSITMTGITGFPYDVWIDDKGFTGARPTRGTNVNYNTTPNGMVDLWDSHIKVIVGASNVRVYKHSYAPSKTSINETTTLSATLSDTSACYNVLGGSDLVQQIFNGFLGYASTGGAGCRTITAAKQNIANWYQYSRRRSLAAKNAVSSVVYNFPDFRYGLSVINNNNSLFVQMPAAGTTDFTTQNASLLSSLTSYEWQALGTPLLSGLELVGRYYAGNLSSRPTPITHSCQQNFSLLLTDGYWDPSSLSTVNSDVDRDGFKVTLADVARYYYVTDLSALPNDVFPNPFDAATYQHMVTFTIAFGVIGNLVDTDNDGLPNPPLTESSNWGDPTTSSVAKIDDVWHASFNSKGTYTAAQSPQQIQKGLANSLSNIASRVSAASGVAQNSTVLQIDSNLYRAQFDSQGWSGSLLAYPISITGILSTTPSWSSGCILTGGACTLPVTAASNTPGVDPNNRVIITPNFVSGSKIGIPFRWPANYSALKVSSALPVRVANLLKFAPYPANATLAKQVTANQLYGQRLINYLRGDRTQEVQNNGAEGFRNRKSILGDFINSKPLYIGPPGRLYSNIFDVASYSTFRSTYQNRTGMVAIGGNDGMLHIFNANTGSEILAYVPGNRKMNFNLPSLSEPTYTHLYFVDGSPSEADIIINNNWRTVLLGNLANGGQGVFALDITDPSTFKEANANSILLWEFSDEDDPDMGYLNSTIQIAKVRSTTAGGTQWAAIFGNGYNNTEADGYASTTGKAALYILFINHGIDDVWTVDTDYIKIPVGAANTTTPNGLAQPYLVDVDGDHIVDYVYAGDLLGNLWKFDLRNANPVNWKTAASTLFSAQSVTAGDQPITTAPIARFHPNGPSAGILLYFGTGKFLEPNDNSAINQVTQSFYAILDKLDGSPVTKSQLLQQKILNEISQTFNGNTVQLRQVSNYGINWQALNQNLGWYINLQAANNSSNFGERQISPAILRGNNVIFSTMLPSPSVCSVGGSSWLMELNADTGGTPIAAPFDLNRDGLFDNMDYILKDSSGNAISATPGGIKSTVGVTATPTVFLTPDKTKEIKVMSGSTGASTITENPSKGPSGRQNWNILR